MEKSNDKPQRRGNGTFANGSSGNPGGRPAKNRRIPHPEEFRDHVYDIAEFKIPATLGGKKGMISLFDANLATIGMAGGKGDPKYALKFIECVIAVTVQEQRVADNLLRRLDGDGTPAYLSETNPEQRAILKKGFDYYFNLANARRDKTTKGLAVRKTRARRGE